MHASSACTRTCGNRSGVAVTASAARAASPTASRFRLDRLKSPSEAALATGKATRCVPHAVITLVERRSGFVRLTWSPDGTADAVSQAIECRMDRLADYIHTITFDRGSEFAEDRRLEKSLKAAIYFADPHSPWQRGCNENLNRLLQQYFPRSRDFSTITMEELQAAEDRLNDRPSKRLGYLTPSEVFFNPNHIALQR